MIVIGGEKLGKESTSPILSVSFIFADSTQIGTGAAVGTKIRSGNSVGTLLVEGTSLGAGVGQPGPPQPPSVGVSEGTSEGTSVGCVDGK
jgi:hypothetical protein